MTEVPKVLFIRNATKKELRVPVKKDEAVIVQYQKLPSKFTSLSSWPKQTDLCCWQCTLPFDGPPKFIPTFFEPSNEPGRYTIGVSGVFCHFNAARDFIIKNYSNCDQIEQLNKLKLLYKVFNDGKSMPDFGEYPSPFIMAKYGGEKTEEEFREMLKNYE
jgi:hypothetical protein